MKTNLLKSSPAWMPGVVAMALLLLVLSSGCAQKTESRSAEEKKFLAPTDLNKLTPEARAQLSRIGKAPAAKP